jgi:hypothetical protein
MSERVESQFVGLDGLKTLGNKKHKQADSLFCTQPQSAMAQKMAIKLPKSTAPGSKRQNKNEHHNIEIGIMQTCKRR